MKKRFYSTVGLLFLLSSFVIAGSPLKRNSWSESAYCALSAVIKNCGIGSDQYDANNKPYAVFDFDNTTSINDVEETLMLYQIEHLCYKITPEEMYSVLTGNLPDVNKPYGIQTPEGKICSIKMLVTDIVSDYTFLYKHYCGLKGNVSLMQIRRSKEYLDFRAKMRFMYITVGDVYSSEIADAWICFLFKNMTAAEIGKLARQSVDYWLKMPFKEITWEAPAMGECGVVKVTLRTGFAITREIKSLYQCLQSNGIDVYICSASLKEVIEGIVTRPKYGICLDSSHVIAVMLCKDAKGRIMNVLDSSYPLTLGEGKVIAIKNMIAPKHGNRGPILICGDSNGDYNMLTEFPDMKCGLIFNRYPKGPLHRLCEKARNEKDSKYVLQGRNENTGTLVPSIESVLLRH